MFFLSFCLDAQLAFDKMRSRDVRMSTYILMKILESAPGIYDRGIRMLTRGRLDAAYGRLTSHIQKGQRVLDLGCGTGALTLRAAERGAQVRGIDINPQMLEIAQQKVAKAHRAQDIELCERGVAELGDEKSESYDIVMGGLSLSELTGDELSYALREVKRILKPRGLLLVADEVRPKSIAKRILHGFLRVPLVIITYLLTQTTTKALKDLPEKIEKVGLTVESVRLSTMEDFVELIGRKPKK
jgi:ubiquinone/menaquinone biosynthesis C-methylase UbiE